MEVEILRKVDGLIEGNIRKLMNLSKKFKSKIIFLGLTPVDETKTMPIPWNTNKSYLNKNIKNHNEVIKSLCKENNLSFFDIFERWIKSNYKELLEDGFHPNSKGHQLILESVKEFLIKNKIIFL